MSDRTLGYLLGAGLIAGALLINQLGHWLHAPYRACVELHSVDTCHRALNP